MRCKINHIRFVSSPKIAPDGDVDGDEEEYACAHDYTWTNSTLEEFTRAYPPRSGWEDFFDNKDTKKCIERISKTIKSQSDAGVTIYPPLHLVYEACNRIAVDRIRVIIIGQDPYHGDGQAMGVAFAVPEGVKRPPSLINLFKEAKSEGISISDNADLSNWMSQGVLLINTALTVQAGEPASHSAHWASPKGYTDMFMRFLDERTGAHQGSGVVVVMLGNWAKRYATYFGPRHRKIFGVHPSPLSASRGFFGSKPLGTINKNLHELGYDKIDWNL